MGKLYRPAQQPLSHKPCDFLRNARSEWCRTNQWNKLTADASRRFGYTFPMDTTTLLRMLVPNVGSLGYALFLAINAAGVWGGVFPFLPMGFQTHEIVFWFFFTQSLAFSMSYVASCVGAYFYPWPTRSFLVRLTSAPYFFGWCCLIAAIYLHGIALALVVVGGAFLGLGSAGFYMLWQRLFASQDSDTGNRDLLVGTAWGAVLYFALYLIPQAVTAFLIPLVFLPLFGLSVMLRSRTINPDQPMFVDVPREHPRVYLRVLRDYWRSALCVGAVGFCAGIMRSVTVADPSIGVYVNALSMAGMLVAALAVLWLWRLKNLRLSIPDSYRVVFPFLITSFLGLPLFSEEYARWLAAILYAVYSAAILLMMMQCAQVSRDRGINPVFIYGFFGAIVYTLHDLGFIGGTFVEFVRVIDLTPLALVAIAAIWALGLMHFIGSGGFSSALGAKSRPEAIELMALRGLPQPVTMEIAAPKEEQGTKDATGIPMVLETAPSPASPVEETATPPAVAEMPSAAPPSGEARDRNVGGTSPAEGVAVDRIAQQAAHLREQYRLSARETEVMELIARGHSVTRIAEMLVVSENTIRTHSKRIYTKLDIHKKQELVDLIESMPTTR